MAQKQQQQPWHLTLRRASGAGRLFVFPPFFGVNKMEVEELDERLQKMLKDPQFRSLVDNMDHIIVFEKGKHKGTVEGSQVHQTKQTKIS